MRFTRSICLKSKFLRPTQDFWIRIFGNRAQESAFLTSFPHTYEFENLWYRGATKKCHVCYAYETIFTERNKEPLWPINILGERWVMAIIWLILVFLLTESASYFSHCQNIPNKAHFKQPNTFLLTFEKLVCSWEMLQLQELKALGERGVNSVRRPLECPVTEFQNCLQTFEFRGS